VRRRKVRPNSKNPYKNRNLPVGQLEYDIGGVDIWRGAMLEFGEEELIFDIPRLVGGGSLINLGDSEGGSAILLAQGLICRDLSGHVCTVDNYDKRAADRSDRNVRRACVQHLVTPLCLTTDRAFRVFNSCSNKDFSFVFIDAGHDYENVKSDWLNYSTLISDGIVAFHDTNQEQVDRVIEELVYPGGWELVEWVNRIKCFSRE
jgi:cephalosporin hydroxylase